MAEKQKPRLAKRYQEEVVPSLMKKLKYENVMQVPRLEKVSINMGVGDAAQDLKALDAALEDLTVISGQKPVVKQAKKAISNFKLRAGMPVGCSVTLRREHMYEFLDRLFSIAIPRVRDFRGLSDKSFDGRGNYTLGVKEQLIFPEIDVDKISKIRGMDITIVTSARTDAEALELLRELGMPFRKN